MKHFAVLIDQQIMQICSITINTLLSCIAVLFLTFLEYYK